MIACERFYHPGFMALWVYSKEGKPGVFRIDYQPDPLQPDNLRLYRSLKNVLVGGIQWQRGLSKPTKFDAWVSLWEPKTLTAEEVLAEGREDLVIFKRGDIMGRIVRVVNKQSKESFSLITTRERLSN